MVAPTQLITIIKQANKLMLQYTIITADTIKTASTYQEAWDYVEHMDAQDYSIQFGESTSPTPTFETFDPVI